MVRGRGGMEEGEEEVVSSIPGGAGSPASLYYKPLKFVCVCVCVCYTRTHAQTAEPIVSKFCMRIEGHLAGNIGYVSCAWVHGGLRERRRK